MIDLKELRKRAGVTQKELAEKSGVSQQLISAIELGKSKNPTYDTMERLLAALKVDKPKAKPKAKPPEKKPEDRKADIESIRKLF